MIIQHYVAKVQQASDSSELGALLLYMFSEDHYRSRNLLTAKLGFSGCFESELGSFSEEISNWRGNPLVRQRIEFEHAILPNFFYEMHNNGTNRVFLINSNTHRLGRVRMLVEFYHYLSSQQVLLSWWMALSRNVEAGFLKFNTTTVHKQEKLHH